MTVVSPVISLPNSQSAAALPTSQPIQRQYATLPRKGNNNVVIGGTLGRSPAPVPPRRDPKTTLSVGRARARSMVAGLGNGSNIGFLEQCILCDTSVICISYNVSRRSRRRKGWSRRDRVDRCEVEQRGVDSHAAAAIDRIEHWSEHPSATENSQYSIASNLQQNHRCGTWSNYLSSACGTRVEHAPSLFLSLDHRVCPCARCPRIEWHCMHETRSRLQLRPLISLPGTISAAAG